MTINIKVMRRGDRRLIESMIKAPAVVELPEHEPHTNEFDLEQLTNDIREEAATGDLNYDLDLQETSDGSGDWD